MSLPRKHQADAPGPFGRDKESDVKKKPTPMPPPGKHPMPGMPPKGNGKKKMPKC